MTSVLRLLLCLAFILVPAAARAVEPERPGQTDFLRAAVYAENRLYLVSAGQLFSLTEADHDARREDAGAKVRDICRVEGGLVALTAGATAESVVLRRHTAEGWAAPVPIATKKDESATLFCEGKSAMLLTDTRLITESAGQTSELALKGELRWGLPATLATTDAIYLGINRGEWGGGLQRIDRATGEITQIEDMIPDSCEGLLNTNCDPVNGLAVLPWRPDCIAAAIGLIHEYGQGRIVTVCGDKIEPLYVKQFGERFANTSLPEDEAYQTLPFYALMPAGDTLMAIGQDGLYTINSSGAATLETMPDFKTIGPFHVSFARPDMILVLTSVNSRMSIGGAVPMLVAR